MNLKSEQRQAQMREQAGMLVEMVQQNTALTELVETCSSRTPNSGPLSKGSKR
jgi:hypothetical protein